MDKWIEQLKSGMCISEMDLKRLCYHIKNLLIEEANVQPVRAPVTVSTTVPHPLRKQFNIAAYKTSYSPTSHPLKPTTDLRRHSRPVF